jgi:hypothetical protein
MRSREYHGSTLSAHRAFVVHLSADGRPGRRRFSGQVEHLSSGRATCFSSLKGLVAFLADILEASAVEARHPADADIRPAAQERRDELTP